MTEEHRVAQVDPRGHVEPEVTTEHTENHRVSLESGVNGAKDMTEPVHAVPQDGTKAVANAQFTLSELRLDQDTGYDPTGLDDDAELLLTTEIQNGGFAVSDVISIAQSALASSMGDDALPTRSEGAETNPQKIRAYAKIEFDDGQFYMDTYQVELGRDVPAAKRALKRKLQQEFADRERGRRGSVSSDEMSNHRYAPSTAVSESGGILNYEVAEHKRRRRSRKDSASPRSSSYSRSRNDSMNEPVPYDYQKMAYKNLGDGYDAEHPSPEDCPLIPIHPPQTNDPNNTGYGGISRRHARISYNFENNWFEFEAFGRNGGFVDDSFVDSEKVAVLDHGSKIQIGGVHMRFLLPNHSEAGRDTNLTSDVHSTMSFQFEDDRGTSLPLLDDSSPSTEHIASNSSSSRDGAEQGDSSGESSHSDSEDEEVEEATASRSRHRVNDISGSRHGRSSKEKGRHHHSKIKTSRDKLKADGRSKSKREGKERSSKLKLLGFEDRTNVEDRDPNALKHIAERLGLDVEELPARRKGPGRPPKDGIMSKREYAQLARQQKEKAKAEGVQSGTFKPSRPLGLGSSPPTGEKRKYTKRRKADDGEDDEDDIRMSIEGADGEEGAAAAKAKEKRPAKPPRSPSPVFDESTLTEEQLAKPTASYVVLIHDALSNSATGQMSLPQIYRAIERKYPFFKIRVTTTGWQSSVRHNLLQNEAFTKIEKEGKGWMWGLVPGVSIEKDKKRRPTPPPAPVPAYYPPSNQAYRPEQYPYPSPQSATPNGHTATNSQPPAHPFNQPPPYGHPAAPLAPMAAAPVYAMNTYRSPYAPTTSVASPEVPPPPYYAKQSYTGHYYNNMKQSQDAPPRPPSHSGPPPSRSPAANAPAPIRIAPFTTSIPGVPEPVISSCSKYKSYLAPRLMEDPSNEQFEPAVRQKNAEQIIDYALDRALRHVMKIPSDAPVPADDIFNQACTLISKIWEATGQGNVPSGHASPPEAAAAAVTAAANTDTGTTANGETASGVVTSSETTAEDTEVKNKVADDQGVRETVSETPTAGSGAAIESERQAATEPEQDAEIKQEAEAVADTVSSNVGSKRSREDNDHFFTPPATRQRSKRLAI